MDCCVQGSICFEWMKGLPAVLVALVFGAIAAGITWRQYKVAKAKLNLDLFERRYAIFHKVWEITTDTFSGGPRSSSFGHTGLSTPFNNFRPEASFLFGKDIEAYIDELIRNWAQYRAVEGLNEEDARKNAESAMALQNYFYEQANGGVKERFAPFLDFANWK
jgi:hypothetical protein